VAIKLGTLLSAKEEGRDLIKEVCECKWPVVLFSAEHLISKDIDRLEFEIMKLKQVYDYSLLE